MEFTLVRVYRFNKDLSVNFRQISAKPLNFNIEITFKDFCQLVIKIVLPACEHAEVFRKREKGCLFLL
jgi:hypothetical protein